MPSYRKIGGLHWLFWGRLRIAFCITHSKPHYRHGVRIHHWESR